MAHTSKQSTVVGVFNDYTTAERVVRDLANEGISRESIEIKSNFMTGAAGRTHVEEGHEGGVSGFFHRLFGGGETDGGHYSEALRRGKAVVSVTAPRQEIEHAVEIMNAAGAVDIDRHVERFRETGYERHDPNAPAYSYDEAVKEREQFGTEPGASIPVLEEDLQIGKRVVRRGGVRVYSHVIEQPVSETVELREEHVSVERRPVNRPVQGNEAGGFRDQTIEVTEMAEEPVVQKRSRVREEVVVGKQTSRRTEKVVDKVRRTKVVVERIGERNEYTEDFRRDWQERYAQSGEDYATFEPAYIYGYRCASDARYRDRSWADAEEELRADYLRDNPSSTWDRMKGAVRHGWEKVTGKL